MPFARISAIEYQFPDFKQTNDILAREQPEWDFRKIEGKTKIASRYVTQGKETALDLAEKACRKLFESGAVRPDEIDALVFCTQTPDFILPPNSTLLQNRVGLPTSVIAFDISHGCSGFVYLLSIAKSLIESGQAKNVLAVTAETYSHHINPNDRSVRTLFGDGAAATLIRAEQADKPFMDHFRFNTDGSGGKNLIVPSSGARKGVMKEGEFDYMLQEGVRTVDDLYMNGGEIYIFTLRTIPLLVRQVLDASGLEIEDLDKVLFHQASGVILEALRKKCGVPPEKYIQHYADCGNTVSSTIPIALKRAMEAGEVKPGDAMLVAGFGVGYSSASAIVRL